MFGAGNIGRGFLGQLFHETGYETTFVDVVEDVIRELNARHAYPVRIVGDETQTLRIENVSAVHAGDREAVAETIAAADLAATAVGVQNLPRIAPAIAAGIERRFAADGAGPLNFIICENMIDAGPYMREQVRQHLSPAFHAALDAQVGFVEASIGRMVPIMTEKEKAEDPLLVCVEPYADLPVDANGFKGDIPPLKNMHPYDNFGAYVERKLFVHNLSHATAAYLGYLRGHEYVWQAVADERVRGEVLAAVGETCEGLVRKHGMDPVALRAHAEDLLHRYSNKGLGDQIARIAKDPIRKLGPKDRLIGSGLMCLEQGVAPEHVAFAAAAAIRYDHPDDDAAQTVQHLYREGGLDRVFTDICKLPADSPLADRIRQQHERLVAEHWVR